jgi:hypothetical protein
MTSLDLDIFRQKRDQDPKQNIKKQNQDAMQRQSEETLISIRKIIETLHPEDSYFRISESQKQEGLKKKKGSKE